jgi:hypothetical protein
MVCRLLVDHARFPSVIEDNASVFDLQFGILLWFP